MKRGMANGTGCLMVRMPVLAPEHESGVRLDLGNDFRHLSLGGQTGLKTHAAVFQEPHVDSALASQLNGKLLQCFSPTFDGWPARVVANEIEDHHPLVLLNGLQEHPGNPKGAVIVVGSNGEDGAGHDGFSERNGWDFDTMTSWCGVEKS